MIAIENSAGLPGPAGPAGVPGLSLAPLLMFSTAPNVIVNGDGLPGTTFTEFALNVQVARAGR
jgi:hypothetical protein